MLANTNRFLKCSDCSLFGAKWGGGGYHNVAHLSTDLLANTSLSLFPVTSCHL